MSNISLKVELPAHSHSFQVQVPESSSIANIKSEISKSCPGRPTVEGQRLIYAGRLLRDDEQIQDIWPVSSPPHKSCHHRVDCGLLICATHRLESSTLANPSFGRASLGLDDWPAKKTSYTPRLCPVANRDHILVLAVHILPDIDLSAIRSPTTIHSCHPRVGTRGSLCYQSSGGSVIPSQ